MHYYKFNIGDYASHTQHLDPIEDIAYRRMLDWLYLNEMPLPEDIDDIARLIRMRTHSESIAIVLREFFHSHSDGYTHPRVERELSAYQEKSDKAKKSAEARWKNKAANNGGSADANALRTECEGNAKHKPLTTNHKTVTNNKKSAPDVAVDFSVFGLPDDIVNEIKRIRVANKGGAIKTQRVANGLAKEIGLAMASGISIDDLLTEWETRKWKSFKAEWMVKNTPVNSIGGLTNRQAVNEWASVGEIEIQGEVVGHG